LLHNSGQAHPKNLAAICQRQPGNALIAKECVSLTGGTPAIDGFALCQKVDHIPQAAYIRAGFQILARGTTLDDLLQTVSSVQFRADLFRIDFHSLSERKQLSPRRTITALADVIPARPNLAYPKHRFLVLERAQGLWFGELLTERKRTYRKHNAKPYRTSTSLSSQLSRALVNLVVLEADSLVDPCCGTGSILLEAQALGMRVFGADRNKKIVGMARKNIEYFGYCAEIEHAEVCAYRQSAEALVTDLPYGRLLDADEMIIRPILEQCSFLAPLAVFVAGCDLTDWLYASGYRDISICTVSKHNRVTRYIHRARVGAG
jgi:tRNA G10  N-methylase Trm11